jgi:hypothetical protein
MDIQFPQNHLLTRLRRYFFASFFSIALFTITKGKNNPLWRDGWINKMWYVHTMEYYLAFKTKKILTNAT